MDPALPRFMTRMILSTTPQQAFAQVDELHLQAAALREQARELQEQIDFLKDRADCLATTAEGLQEIAEQDRDAIQTMFERSLCIYQHMYTVYVSAPRREARFNDIKTRSEDGMVTMEEMEEFLEDVYQHFLPTFERVERSAAPEPESPPTLNALSSAAQAQNQSETEVPIKQGLKRKFSTFQEDENGIDADSERANKGNDAVESSDEASSDEDCQDESTNNVETNEESSCEGTEDVEESPGEESGSASGEDSDNECDDSEVVGSSDGETESDSSK
ncbi:hypothetical protein FOPE_05965 [Fonsecaea pedrosoi]|nr:hypothetical protein FOPE_05965 [Fonsecaea pedrosoi]